MTFGLLNSFKTCLITRNFRNFFIQNTKLCNHSFHTTCHCKVYNLLPKKNWFVSSLVRRYQRDFFSLKVAKYGLFISMSGAFVCLIQSYKGKGHWKSYICIYVIL